MCITVNSYLSIYPRRFFESVDQTVCLSNPLYSYLSIYLSLNPCRFIYINLSLCLCFLPVNSYLSIYLSIYPCRLIYISTLEEKRGEVCHGWPPPLGVELRVRTVGDDAGAGRVEEGGVSADDIELLWAHNRLGVIAECSKGNRCRTLQFFLGQSLSVATFRSHRVGSSRQWL